MMTTLTHAMPRSDARPTSLRAAFAVLVLAMLPAVLDQTVLATALPTIAGELGSLGDISHLVTVYVLASTASTPLWGKLGDRHGRRALLGGALSLFLVASAACGVAQNLDQLIVARGIQARRRRADVARDGERRRPRRPARARPLAGPHRHRLRRRGRRRPADRGPLVEHASWRWVFYINLPVGLLALAGLWRYLPAGTREREPRPLDLLGAGLLAVASASALLVLSWGGETLAWGSAELLGWPRWPSSRAWASPSASAAPPTRSCAGDARHADGPRRRGRPVPRDGVAVRGDRVRAGAAAGLAGFRPIYAGLLLATMTIGMTCRDHCGRTAHRSQRRLRRLPSRASWSMARRWPALRLRAGRVALAVVAAYGVRRGLWPDVAAARVACRTASSARASA